MSLAKAEAEKFMDKATDLNDPYWKLFECKTAVNDSLVQATRYGFEKGFECAEDKIIGLQEALKQMSTLCYNSNYEEAKKILLKFGL